ncbi:MAG: hypothetical protein R3B90_21005 [Planctomycetaceae bacterium]
MDGGAGNAADLPTDDRNLVVRAARLLQTRMSEQGAEPRGADVELVKRIPWQSGLGASSDAAATLDGLNRLWGCGLAAAELHSLAAASSDVNFFLDSQPAALARDAVSWSHRLSLHRRLPLVLLQPGGGYPPRPSSPSGGPEASQPQLSRLWSGWRKPIVPRGESHCTMNWSRLRRGCIRESRQPRSPAARS